MSCRCHTNESCEKDKNFSSCFAMVNTENIAHCPFPNERMRVFTKSSGQWKMETKMANELSNYISSCPKEIPHRGKPTNYPNYCFSTPACSEKYESGCSYVYKPRAYMLVHKPCMKEDMCPQQSSTQQLSVATTMCETNEDCRPQGKKCNLKTFQCQ